MVAKKNPDCPCPSTGCPNHGYCEKCRENHHSQGGKTYCERLKEKK